MTGVTKHCSGGNSMLLVFLHCSSSSTAIPPLSHTHVKTQNTHTHTYLALRPRHDLPRPVPPGPQAQQVPPG